LVTSESSTGTQWLTANKYRGKRKRKILTATRNGGGDGRSDCPTKNGGIVRTKVIEVVRRKGLVEHRGGPF